MTEATNAPANGSTGPMHSQQAPAPTITIEQLAAKVYQLMLEDARLARARGENTRARK
jgi:hypothetical protein